MGWKSFSEGGQFGPATAEPRAGKKPNAIKCSKVVGMNHRKAFDKPKWHGAVLGCLCKQQMAELMAKGLVCVGESVNPTQSQRHDSLFWVCEAGDVGGRVPGERLNFRVGLSPRGEYDLKMTFELKAQAALYILEVLF